MLVALIKFAEIISLINDIEAEMAEIVENSGRFGLTMEETARYNSLVCALARTKCEDTNAIEFIAAGNAAILGESTQDWLDWLTA